MKKNNILIIPNLLKEETIQYAKQLIVFLKNNKQNVYLFPEHKSNINESQVYTLSSDNINCIDAAIILGGDGTVLKSVKRLSRFDLPLLGINFGHLGYLTECEPVNALECLNKFLNDEYKIEEKILLKCQLIRNDIIISEFLGLNEAVIYRDTLSRALQLKLNINNNYIETFFADGILTATPTGSTAYNLSAGGPILTPNADNFVITPICSFTMPNYSIVTSGNDIIDIIIESFQSYTEKNNEVPTLTIDSFEKLKLKINDHIRIQKSEHTIKTIKISKDNFYSTLRHRLSNTFKQ